MPTLYNEKRKIAIQRKILQLREQNLSFSTIGKQLNMSRQYVNLLAHYVPRKPWWKGKNKQVADYLQKTISKNNRIKEKIRKRRLIQGVVTRPLKR